MSTELTSKIDGILSQVAIPERHTYFQIEKFLIGKEPTAQAQLWSIARELQARRETIETYEKDLADAEDNLELFDVKIARLDKQISDVKGMPEQDLNIKECEINIRKLQREKDALVKSAQKANNRLKGVCEEAAHLLSGFEKIIAATGEQPKPFDDDQSQREMWNEKLLEEFNLRFILRIPFDAEFIKTVMCLPDESSAKKQVVHMINNIQNEMSRSKISEKKAPQVTVTPKIAGK